MKKTFLVLAALSFVVTATSANALSTVNYVDGTLQNSDQGVTGYSTSGSDMYGMTLTFAWGGLGGGLTDTYTWGSLGNNQSGINMLFDYNGSTYSAGTMRQNGDTFDFDWKLDTIYSDWTVDSIFIDAGAGDSVFDVWGSPVGTAGSASGLAFDPTHYGNGFDIVATYSGAVGVGGANAVGDLYRYLNIDFVGQDFDGRDFLSFRADTDSLIVNGDIGPNPVPEPTTILLMGLGLVGLVGYNRKRLTKKS